jgi:hypothetical protein
LRELTLLDRYIAQKGIDTMFDPRPLYLLESEAFKTEYTIKFIKEETKGWTVGPYDFGARATCKTYGEMPTYVYGTNMTCNHDRFIHLAMRDMHEKC